jgi:hypothetical protein
MDNNNGLLNMQLKNSSLEIKHGSPETMRDSPETMRNSPETMRNSPEIKLNHGGARPSALLIPNADELYPKDCGTKTTPPCPPPDPFLEARKALINALAGPDAPTERRRGVTAYIDGFLQVALRSTLELINGTGVKPVPEPIQVEIADGIARITVGSGAQSATLAAVFEAFAINQIVVNGPLPTRD